MTDNDDRKDGSTNFRRTFAAQQGYQLTAPFLYRPMVPTGLRQQRRRWMVGAQRGLVMLTVHSILKHKGRAIYQVGPDSTVYDALRAMAEHNCGALLVIEGRRAIGILSERDYARKVVLLGKLSKETPVREIMEQNVIRVPIDASVATCMQIMTESRSRHLVVSEGGEVVGVISIGDVVKAVIDEQTFTIKQLETYISGSA